MLSPASGTEPILGTTGAMLLRLEDVEAVDPTDTAAAEVEVIVAAVKSEIL